MSLMDRIKKTSSIEIAGVLADSDVFENNQVIHTEIPILNLALSGTLRGGLTSGVTQIAGPSKHFKTGLALMLIRSFLKQYADGVVLFYDAEFGTPQSYFKTFNIDTSKIFHTPITDVEQLKHDIMIQLAEFKRGDHVMVVLDSLGQLASLKEVDDAIEGKQVADMSRAKQLKSLFRMVTPHLRIKDIPFVVVNHTYKTIEMYSKDVPGGGTGAYYAADNILIVGRQQEKVDGDVTGFNFILNAEKSRFVKEKSKFPIAVRFEGGIEPYSGLLENAIEGGFVEKPSPGWYCKIDPVTKTRGTKFREADTKSETFWHDILENEAFHDYMAKKFGLSFGDILASNESDPAP